MRSDYETACRHMEEAGRLSGDMRRWKLFEALRLFEQSNDKIRGLLIEERQALMTRRYHYCPEEFEINSSGVLVGANINITSAKSYRVAALHLEHEYRWLLNLIGILRTAIEIGDTKLISIKKENLSNAIDESINFANEAYNKIVYDYRSTRQDYSFHVLPRLFYHPFVKSSKKYHSIYKSEFQRTINSLNGLKYKE